MRVGVMMSFGVAFAVCWPEHVVVVSFMACMAQPQMRDMLMKEAAPSWRTAFKPTSWKRKAPAPALPPGADAKLVARMAAALAEITAQAWPPASAPTGSASEAGHGLAA